MSEQTKPTFDTKMSKFEEEYNSEDDYFKVDESMLFVDRGLPKFLWGKGTNEDDDDYDDYDEDDYDESIKVDSRYEINYSRED